MMECKDIACVVGVTDSRVRQIISTAIRKLWRRRIAQMRGHNRYYYRNPRHLSRDYQIAELRRQTLSLRQIAAMLGVSRRTVCRGQQRAKLHHG